MEKKKRGHRPKVCVNINIQTLRDARKSKGYTQQQIADMIYTERCNYNKYETGKRCVSPQTIELLCDILDIKQSDLSLN